ncbi:E3 ubiquitin/ISG15 ligase TRIM25-like [Lycodopsis pacificus]
MSAAGEVPCDVCTGTKLKALKSCLVCLVSYCETHLEPHLTMSGLKRHQLIDPVENLEARMCTKHDKLLELFCKTDQMCVCMLCTISDHKNHDVVPLEEEYEGKKAELGKTETEIQQMIQKRRVKIQEIKHSVELSEEDADREMADGVQVFTALKESVERSQAELIDTIKEKQRKTEKQAEGFIKELEQEISELKKRSTEVEQLSRAEDHLGMLQSFRTLNTAPPTKDWTGVRVSPLHEGTMRKALNQLEETISERIKNLLEDELKRAQQSAVDVTLDPDTANPYLILSDDGKQVKCGDVEKNLPDNPERFDPCTCVLAKQSFSSGRFYYEVQVKGKTDWDLGVVRESINRKGQIKLSPQKGYWMIWLRNKNQYEACADSLVSLSLKSRPQKVGVFVDYEEGLVSFYDVDAAALMYSFTGCCFTEKLHPYFSPDLNNDGKNSAPLIIFPVNHTDVDMSAASCLLTEDQFLCSICLDVFTDPVTTPCGHNFCKTCITQHWNVNVQTQCPNCKEVFNTRPELQVNTLISLMAAQFRQSAQQKASSSSSEQQAAKPGEVPCDVCPGTKLKALKSCLVCLDSYCETHLEPHLTRSGLKRHQLIDPVENLEGRMCTKHDKLLELFCKTDQMCVCMLCSVSDHKNHDVVPLKLGYEGKKAELEDQIQQMIQKRRLKLQEIKHSVELSEEAADREIADGVQVFTALKESVERSQAELINTIKEKQRKTEKQAEGFTKQLEHELSELEKRSTEVEQLSRSEDHLHLLQSFRTLNTAPPTKNWTGVRVSPPSYEGTVRRAVNQLEETLSKQMKKLLEVELKRIQQSAVDVTLDPDTAHPKLILSDDGKQVHDSDVRKNLPDNPERFDYCPIVLAKQSFSSGRFYYEVQVKEKTQWYLGVVRESINRKGGITVSPQEGYWTIWMKNENENRYKACAGPSVLLSLKSRPQKVGVFVDYEEGLVSFYDVDAAALIYSFTGCCFTEKLYPFFAPGPNAGGKNSAPLIISPVNPVNHQQQCTQE